MKTVRLISLAPVISGLAPEHDLHQIELCQPFYAAAALATGFHHMPAMPCAVNVWQEGDDVRISMLHPDFIFGYFFLDAFPNLPPHMQSLFAIFPTAVFNEMVAVVNGGLGEMGYDPMPLAPLPVDVECPAP